jgi:hypothetical protein
MFRKITLVTTLVVAFFASFAHASLSETTYNKYSQSASLAAYQLFNPVGPYTGNYQISIYLDGNADACGGATEGNMLVTVAWTDEQGPQTSTLFISGNPGNSCATTNSNGFSGPQVFMIHPLAETAVYVSVALNSPGASPVYNLSVNAIGFW